MPAISNATVATGTGLSTAGNGGRKLVRLDNGASISIIKDGLNFLVRKSNDGNTWSNIYTGSVASSLQDVCLATQGNFIYVLASYNNGFVLARVLDSSGNQVANSAVESTSQTAIGNVSLAINESGTELHAAWSSKNATYPNSFNIRYAKGVINGDGSVTWGVVEQWTSYNNSGIDYKNPSIVMMNDRPIVFAEGSGNPKQIIALSKSGMANAPVQGLVAVPWTIMYDGSTYVQSSPSSLFVPTAINGLANGRLWVGWHGKDATDSAKFNIRVSFSDDGGVTWSTPVKLTSGNTFDRLNVSLSADKTGKVFALYEDHQWSPDLDIYMRTFSNGSWGAPVVVAEAEPAAETNPSALVDFSLQMTTPPFVYTDATLGIRFTGNFNVGASVSPVSGALGNKESQSLTAYTVTPEAGSTVTQIVERINGVIVNTFNNPASLSRTLTVPTATWDTLAYFANHTASVTVTDSNGAQTVTTYTFDKRLGTGASLLEATKANNDARNRISTKRDALAAQVGLSAGSTFDAISAQLETGLAFKKFATGTTAVSGNALTVSGLTFKPSYILVNFSGYTGNYTIHDSRINPNTFFTVINSTQTVFRSVSENGGYITAEGFRLMIVSSGVATWIAIQ